MMRISTIIIIFISHSFQSHFTAITHCKNWQKQWSNHNSNLQRAKTSTLNTKPIKMRKIGLNKSCNRIKLKWKTFFCCALKRVKRVNMQAKPGKLCYICKPIIWTYRMCHTDAPPIRWFFVCFELCVRCTRLQKCGNKNDLLWHAIYRSRWNFCIF